MASGTVARATLRTSYHGTGQALFALVFKNLLLTVLTIGCYLPWARTERRKYLWQNVEFDGHRLRYHGTGKEMALGYLKVAVAYVVLLGIPVALTRINRVTGVVAQLVGFAILVPLLPLAIYGSRRYLLGRTSLRSVRFGLEKGAGGYLRLFLVGLVLTIVTLGLYGPVMQNTLRRYVTERSRFGSASFAYDGDHSTAWKISMKGGILSLLTLGLYYPWFIAEMARFRVESTSIKGSRCKLALTGTDVFWLLFVSVLGTVLSLGIAFPWVTSHVLRTIASKLTLVGDLDYAAIGQRPASGDAAADGFAAAFDVGLEV